MTATGVAAASESRQAWLTQARAARIAWALWGIGLLLRAIQLWVASRPGLTGLVGYGIEFSTHLLAATIGLSSATVGAVILARRPTNVIAWLLALVGVLQGATGLSNAYAAQVLAAGPSQPAIAVAMLAAIVLQTSVLAVTATSLAVFPNGRLLSPRWRLIWPLIGGGVVLRALEIGIGKDALFLIPAISNPYRASGTIGTIVGASYSVGAGFILLTLAVLLGAAALVIRYRRAELDERRQIRWIVVAGAALVVGAIPFVILTLTRASQPQSDSWALGLLFVASNGVPVAILVAITRYRLYEIDRIINRAVLYGSLTAILAGVFTAGIALAQRLFMSLTGERSDAAIVLTTLVVATLYAPLRKRLEWIVDRRFKFDEAQFGAYRDELGRILSIVDPALAAQRLAAEAVAELGATGGAVLSDTGAPTATAGQWPQEFVDRLAIPGGAGPLTAVVVGPRLDGRPHDQARLDELQRVAGMVARAARSPDPDQAARSTEGNRTDRHRGASAPD